MKFSFKQRLVLLLVLVMALPLSACHQGVRKEQERTATAIESKPKLEETVSSSAATDRKSASQTARSMTTKPSVETTMKEHSATPSSQPEAEETEEVEPATALLSQEDEKSLDLLRDRIDFPTTRFGIAYLGYVGGLFEEGFESGFPQWLSDTNPGMLRRYPFIAAIPRDHIIGEVGHLYCLVPVDKKASVAINRVEWNEKTKKDEVTEVLYRSEEGEPVLLFANLDGVAYEADTQIFVTDSDGSSCDWFPSLDAPSRLAPCLSEEGEPLSFDFTEYTWFDAPPELAKRMADGWLGMTALGLGGSQSSGMGWTTETTVGETNRKAFFSLRFYPGDDEGGQVDLDWSYVDSDDFNEMWSGFWTIQPILDGPSYVTLSLSLVGGKNYEDTDGPRYLRETYPLLISPSGTELVIGAGQNNIPLPFMSQSTVLCELSQSAG